MSINLEPSVTRKALSQSRNAAPQNQSNRFRNKSVSSDAPEAPPSRSSSKQPTKLGIPHISCKCWVILDVSTMTIVNGRREYQKREVASLTKIMTCHVVLQLCKQWQLNIAKTRVLVSDVAANIRGTTAMLKTGDLLTVEKLLYGLMLPSGNDAAFALAQFFGFKLFTKKYCPADITRIRSHQFDYHPYYAKYFLKEMNLYCTRYGLSCTTFDSPHGLQNVENVSNAIDMAKLTAICMQNETFRRIVKSEAFETDVKRIAGITDFLRGVTVEEKENASKLSKLEQRKLRDRLS